MLPMTITGDTAIQTRDSYQQKEKPMMRPINIAHPPSICGAKLSVLTPLMIEVSYAIALVKTLVPFSLSSNQPMFFLRIAEYRSCLTFSVTFSPNVPKEIF